MTEVELKILRTLLAGSNLNSQRLYEQAISAPYVTRCLTEDGYECQIPYVLDDSTLIECNAKIASPSICLTLTGGVKAVFSTQILKGGFLRGIRAERLGEGSWPKAWGLAGEDQLLASGVPGWVPPPDAAGQSSLALSKLLNWCDMDLSIAREAVCDIFRAAPPAAASEIALCEHKLKIKLTGQYLEFIQIANGVSFQDVRSIDIYGTAEISYLDTGNCWLHLTCLDEEGNVAVRCANGTVTNECYAFNWETLPVLVGSIKQYIRDVLVRIERQTD